MDAAVNAGSRTRRLAALTLLAALATGAGAATMRDARAPDVELHWLPAAAAGPRPTVVALHGCGGLYARSGKLDRRYTEYAERWNAAGWNVLLVDSFSGRGVASICSQRNSERTVTVAQRRGDVNGALSWLAARPEVDAARVALVGWSNGGSTVLRTVDRPAWTLAPVAAVAFYPGCAAALRDPAYAPATPLTLLLGALDDWTPPQPCLDLAARLRARGATVETVVYADSYHGFDGTAPVRLRADVPNGVNAGSVHVGGNPAARSDALPRVDAVLQNAFK